MASRRKVPREPVDWGLVRARVEAAGRELAEDGASSPARARDVLEQRARRLARPLAIPPTNVLELLRFRLANEEYGIESRYVFEVFRLAELTPLPGAESPVFGVTAWRGELLTILDLRQVLGVSRSSLDDLSRVIVLGLERPAFGVLADAVRELVTVSVSDVLEATGGVVLNRKYLRGVTTDAVLVLEAKELLG